jgi:hypothetical protein
MVFMVCATAERPRKEGNQESFCFFFQKEALFFFEKRTKKTFIRFYFSLRAAFR